MFFFRSSPRKRGSKVPKGCTLRLWIPACAGMSGEANKTVWSQSAENRLRGGGNGFLRLTPTDAHVARQPPPRTRIIPIQTIGSVIRIIPADIKFR